MTLVAVLVLIGWQLQSTAMKSVAPGFAAMDSATALVLAFTGVALVLTVRRRLADGPSPGCRSAAVVVLTEIRGEADATAAAKRILAELSRPIEIGDNEVSISGSIGISLAPGDGRDGDTLVQRADRALYRAKEQRGAFAYLDDLPMPNPGDAGGAAPQPT